MPIPQLKRRSSDSWRNYRVSRGIKTTKNKNSKFPVKKLIFLLLGIGVAGIVILSVYATWISRDLPNPNQLLNREIAQSTKIYDRTGEHVLYEISGDEKRTLVELKDIPDWVKKATIAIEDKNFYNHGAFSVWSMFRTAITNVIFNRSAGGSTLTQQFIKNAVLTPEKTIPRKIKELVLSYRLEQKFSKDEILQMYLNEIPYGSNAYGIEAASQKYFGKSVKDVSLAEAAVLGAIVQTPTRYSPYGPNKDLLLGRKDYVLDLMEAQGYISEQERDDAKKEEIEFNGPETNITAPHFVMYIKSILTEKYGEKMVEQEGLKIYTTLDLYKQEAAEEAITKITENYPEKYNANNAALVAIDPKTGQILSMVGSRDYFDDSIDGQVNVATRPRQPGSSMKPLVYTALFEKGYTPDTLLYDVNTNFSTNPNEPYSPKNYDLKERGPVSIRQALAGSLNIPAVKAIYLADINNVIDLAENLGYSTLYPRSNFGLSFVLGGAEVKLLEHVNAYSAFARDGEINSIVGILKIEDKDGKIIEEYKPSSKKALDSQAVRMVNSILIDNNARAYVFGTNNYLNLGDRQVGAKTGTTNDYRDAWTIGYTPSLVAGVWVGNSNNDAMKGHPGGSVVAAPIWHEFMSKVLGDTPKETFKAPDDYTRGKAILDGQIPTQSIKIDVSTGEPANDNTPSELINEVNVPEYHNILYYVNRDNPTGDAPKNPGDDSQFDLWESAVQNWAKENASSSPFYQSSDNSNNNSGDNGPKIKIISPTANQTITSPELLVKTEAIDNRKISRSEYYINNNLWETKYGTLDAFNKSINSLNNGYHSLKVWTCDEEENCGSTLVNFNLLINNNPVSTLKNSIVISSPNNGVSASKIDFPLRVEMWVGRPERVAKINLLALSDKTGTVLTLKNKDTQISNNLNLFWEVAPPPGSYSLYAILSDWNGDIIKSAEIKVNVK